MRQAAGLVVAVLGMLVIALIVGVDVLTDEDSSTSGTSRPVDATSPLTCLTDRASPADDVFDDSGSRTVEAVVRKAAVGNDVRLEGTTAWLLRPDGTAYARLEIEPGPGTGYVVGSSETCAAEPAPPVAAVEHPVPIDLSCRTDQRSIGTLDYFSPVTGGRSALEVAQAVADGGSVVVEGRRTAWLLRGDGTAFAKLWLEGNEHTGYRVGGSEDCADDGVFPVGGRGDQAVLDLTSCAIGSVTFEDQQWTLPPDQQFGLGTDHPAGISGIGRVRWWSATEDVVEYVDRAGGRLRLVAAEPAEPAEPAAC